MSSINFDLNSNNPWSSTFDIQYFISEVMELSSVQLHIISILHKILTIKESLTFNILNLMSKLGRVNLVQLGQNQDYWIGLAMGVCVQSVRFLLLILVHFPITLRGRSLMTSATLGGGGVNQILTFADRGEGGSVKV